jgi:Type VI secretion system/phage-baseplate injector OB domain
MSGGHEPHRFPGKYRGKVVANVDPLFQGRILADVPAVPGGRLGWALPCTPYAGRDVGFYAIPPIGANVWIEFEGGDPNYPVWVGCFWGPGDMLRLPKRPSPEVKVFKTEFATLTVTDVPETGGVTLTCLPPAVDTPVTMTLDSSGIAIRCGGSTIRMTGGSIALTVPDSAIVVAPEAITVSVPPSSATMSTAEIQIEAQKIIGPQAPG